MPTTPERCTEYARFLEIDAAFKAGDLAALRAAVADPAAIPNGPLPMAIGSSLEYAIYHSPLPFIRTLLELGADPNPTDYAGFPPLLAALSGGRPELRTILELLLAFGADPNQRGINDYTPLHLAVCLGNPEAVVILLHAGADREARTRIDDYVTPRELAEAAGFGEIVKLLDAKSPRRTK